MAYLKSELFKYFKISRILRNNLAELKSALVESKHHYDDLLSRQTYILDRYQQTQLELKEFLSKIDLLKQPKARRSKAGRGGGNELIAMEKEILGLLDNNILELFRQGDRSTRDLEQSFHDIKLTLDQSLQNLSKYLKEQQQSDLPASVKETLLKYIKQKRREKKTFLRQELTRLMQYDDVSSSSVTTSLPVLNQIQMEIQNYHSEMNPKMIQLRETFHLYKQCLSKLKQHIQRNKEIWEEKESYVLKINDTIRQLKNLLDAEVASDTPILTELHNAYEEKKLILEFYQQLLYNVNVTITSLKSKCQEYQSLMKTIYKEIQLHMSLASSSQQQQQLSSDMLTFRQNITTNNLSPSSFAKQFKTLLDQRDQRKE